jgi:hypothetical protein
LPISDELDFFWGDIVHLQIEMVLVILSYLYLVPCVKVRQKHPLKALKIGFSIASPVYLLLLFSTVVLQVRGIARISGDAVEIDP